MPTSAFKSTSRRTHSSTTTTAAADKQPNSLKSTQKVPPRRSRSVSAFSGAHLDVTSEFDNKRDNPLFWVDGSPLSDGETEVEPSKSDGISSKLIDLPSLKGLGGGSDAGSGETRRGRTISRNFGGGRELSGGAAGGGRKVLGRSLSRVDTGRRPRSSSRGHCGSSENEKEQENALLSKLNHKSKINSTANCRLSEQKYKLARSSSDLSEVLKTRNALSCQHCTCETSDNSAVSLYSGLRIPYWDDLKSSSLVPEAEEKTIRPVSERKEITRLKEDNDTTGGVLETVCTEVRQAMADMKHDLKNVMLRSNSDSISGRILCDIAPELGNPDAVEFIRDIRGEYAKELEECEERARMLRGELAAEEHYELELNELLSDIIPEPKTPQVQKPRPVRKLASLERRKMSRCLEEEAMNYFDECVSISTFDDSDFSSLEDPPSTVVRFSVPGDDAAISGAPSKANVVHSFENQGLSSQSSLVQCHEHSILSATSGCNDLPHASSSNVMTRPRFSFSPKPSGTTSFEQDIRNFVKLSKDTSRRDYHYSETVSSGQQNTEDFMSQLPVETFLLDRMNFRQRLESGSMLLCGGGFEFPLAPFSSALW